MKWTVEKGETAVRTKKAGLLTKIVVLTLLIGATVTLLRMHRQILQAQGELEEKQLQVDEQSQVNADLQDAIDHSNDPDRQQDIARSEFGLVGPGDKVIVFTD